MNSRDDHIRSLSVRNRLLEERLEDLSERCARQQKTIEELTDIIHTHLPSRKGFFLWQEGGRKI